MFDVVGRGIDDTGDEIHVRRQAMTLEVAVFVLVARIRHRDHQRANMRLVQLRQNRFERNVVIVRSLVIAPAHVQPYAVGRDLFDRAIDR